MDLRNVCGRLATCLLAAVFFAGAAGCGTLREYWSPTRNGADDEAVLEKAAAETKPEVAASETAKAAAAGTPAKPDVNSTAPSNAAGPDAALLAALAKDAWSLNVVLPGAKDADSAFRWHNPALDSILRLPVEKRPDVATLCDHKDPMTATNAAIILARWGQPAPQACLLAAVRNEALRLPVRRAALEALGHTTAPSPVVALESLLKEYGEFAGPAAQAYSAEVHADILFALAKRGKVGTQPYWIAGLKSPDPLVRVAALGAWAASDRELPTAAVELRGDGDTRVRIAAMHALGQRRHPQAHEHLRRGLDDYDLNVRLAAVAALGELGSDEARATLEKTRQGPAEALRAAAVEALAVIGADAAVADAVGDKSWRVRQAVANALRQQPGMATRSPREAARLVAQLLGDRNPQVKQSAIVAVADWPLQEAGPLLFTAMRDGSYLVRKTAAAQLSRRWAPGADFPIDGSAESRTAAIERLHTQWGAEFGGLAPSVLLAGAEAPATALARIESQFHSQVSTTGAEGGASAAPPANADAVVRALAQLNDAQLPKSARRAAILSLRDFGAGIIPVLEQLAHDEARPLPDDIFTEVLPQASGTFAAIDQLRAGEASQRWVAADQLAALAAEHVMSPLALDRLATLMTGQKDPLVWQSVLAAVARDGREPAVRMAYMAVANESAEVRRRACEYLDQHADAKHAAALLPLIDDSQGTVASAAVRAIGSGGALDDPAPLVALLTRPDKSVRLAAATTLTRLRAREGVAAMERLAADPDADLRRSVASAMGQLGDPVFIPTLILLLDDRHDIARAALDALAAIVGRDVAARPGNDSPPTVSERIRRWQSWYRESQETSERP